MVAGKLAQTGKSLFLAAGGHAALLARALGVCVFFSSVWPVSAQSLDGMWQIATDPGNVGRGQKWFDGEAPAGARACPVPGVLELTFPGYDGLVWYWRAFEAAPLAKNERLLLKFHAADYRADVWVNGMHVGSHDGGETPFELDITKAASPGRNRLAVRILNPGGKETDGLTLATIPHGIKGEARVQSWPNVGGLWQSVELRRVCAVRTVDLFADGRVAEQTVEASIRLANDTGEPVIARMIVEIAPAVGGHPVLQQEQEIQIPGGGERLVLSLKMPSAHAWSPEDPFLYRVSVRLTSPAGSDEYAVRLGFREFVFRDGYFRLNGKRVFLRGALYVGHMPIGLHTAHDPELFRREVLDAKAMGLNTLRWLGRTMLPSQLDLCDEVGMMVYQESYASWRWQDSPEMKERFDRSVSEMILRDRNHPSMVIWGLLNETPDGPVFRHATAMLPLVRGLDPSRLVMLNSGRWDGDPSVGSLSNPRTAQWQHVFGDEAPDAKKGAAAGDIHSYPGWPPRGRLPFGAFGAKGKNVFLSEYGFGSEVDPVRIMRLYEQNGASPDLEDVRFQRGYYELLLADWKRWGLDHWFATPSEVMYEGQRLASQKRLEALNAIRSNPKLCGASLTSLADCCFDGEGLMTLFHEMKPGVMDALRDGFAPLRWCVFTDPACVYRGSTQHVEAVLANEDVLRPGEYPVRLRIVGPGGLVFEKAQMLTIPDPKGAPEPPMVFPVFKEDVVIDGPEGKYDVAVLFDQGAAAVGLQNFSVADRRRLPNVEGIRVTVWEGGSRLSDWLRERGATVSAFDPSRPPAGRDLIVTGDRDGGLSDAAFWDALLARVRDGSVAVVLSSDALGTAKDSLCFLPLEQKGALVDSAPRWCGRDDVVVPHPIFAGLPARTVMDFTTYRQVIPFASFIRFSQAAEVIVPCFTVGDTDGKRSTAGYFSGANLLIHTVGKGKLVLTTLRLVENLGKDPAADRITVNMVLYGAAATKCASVVKQP